MVRRDERPSPPRVSEPDLPRHLDEHEGLSAREELFQADITGLALETDAAHVALTECRVAAASVVSLDLAGAQLVDVIADQLRATTLTARRSRWRRVRIEGGRIGTLDLSDSDLDEVELRGLRVDYLSLASARVEDLIVVDCTITALDLPEAVVSRIRFVDTRADEVDTRAMKADDLDLRGLEALAYTDAASLRGATLSARQTELLAPAFAATLGIHVQD